ncbi:hypothetical protein DFR34_10396 [Rivihabitans pingtungensis]|uniref:Uncharacterized protein n=1 Tax=Rivihabitans pingtungensis TaxID=1054498 RepID=A0A318KYC7_9NEIS|nr:hypothetical protein DFR34_10396 [Rivihabitans pingtungensis]
MAHQHAVFVHHRVGVRLAGKAHAQLVFGRQLHTDDDPGGAFVGGIIQWLAIGQNRIRVALGVQPAQHGVGLKRIRRGFDKARPARVGFQLRARQAGRHTQQQGKTAQPLPRANTRRRVIQHQQAGGDTQQYHANQAIARTGKKRHRHRTQGPRCQQRGGHGHLTPAAAHPAERLGHAQRQKQIGQIRHLHLAIENAGRVKRRLAQHQPGPQIVRPLNPHRQTQRHKHPVEHHRARAARCGAAQLHHPHAQQQGQRAFQPLAAQLFQGFLGVHGHGGNLNQQPGRQRQINPQSGLAAPLRRHRLTHRRHTEHTQGQPGHQRIAQGHGVRNRPDNQ